MRVCNGCGMILPASEPDHKSEQCLANLKQIVTIQKGAIEARRREDLERGEHERRWYIAQLVLLSGIGETHDFMMEQKVDAAVKLTEILEKKGVAPWGKKR